MHYPRRRLSRAIGACCAGLGCAVALIGCGSGTPVTHNNDERSDAARHARAASVCPDRGAGADQKWREISRLRSTRVQSGQLAPSGVRWTTICNGRGAKVLKGGPFDGVLNSARPYHGQFCAAVAVSPVLVILRYTGSIRRFIIYVGGCPDVILNDGTKLFFVIAKLQRAAAILGLP